MIREIYVDSRRRSEGEYGNSYTLFIQTPLKNVTRVDLVAATIPNTVYNITNGSNIFSVSSSNVSIANGFYSVSSLVSAVNDRLVTMPRLTFLCEEGKMMMYSNVSSFSLDVFSNEFSYVTGLYSSNSKIATTSNGVFSTSYTGMNFIKANNVSNFKACGEYIYLDIDELRRPFSIDAVTNVYNSQSSTIFAVIPLDVSSGSLKTFKEQSDYKISVEYPKPIDKIDRLTINWRDFHGNLINFNGVEDNSFILRFYEEDVLKQETRKEEESPLPELNKKDKKTVFILLIISLIFILFIKHK